MAINLGQLLQGPNSGSYTPETIDRRRQMAQAMMKGGSGIQDIKHPLQGLAQMLQAGIGGYQANRADEDEATQRSAANERIAQLLGSGMDAPMSDLTSAAGDPWASDANQQLAMMLLGEQVKKQNAPPPEPGFALLSPDEVAAAGLPEGGAYQRGPDNKIYEIGGGGTTINNMGNIPAGYELFTDPETGASRMQPIAGSPAAVEAQAATDAAALSDERTDLKGGVVVEDIDRALQSITDNPMMTTGIGSAVTGGIPATPAYNVNALIDTVKANAGFAELQAMRESSPTGGALGNVTEKEISYLQSTIGNLDPRQSPEQLADNLKRVKNAYLDVIHGPGQGPPREPLSFQSEADPAVSDPTLGPPPEGLSPEEWQFLTPEERALWQN